MGRKVFGINGRNRSQFVKSLFGPFVSYVLDIFYVLKLFLFMGIKEKKIDRNKRYLTKINEFFLQPAAFAVREFQWLLRLTFTIKI